MHAALGEGIHLQRPRLHKVFCDHDAAEHSCCSWHGLPFNQHVPCGYWPDVLLCQMIKKADLTLSIIVANPAS